MVILIQFSVTTSQLAIDILAKCAYMYVISLEYTIFKWKEIKSPFIKCFKRYAHINMRLSKPCVGST